jgi:hypothetical protein
VLNQTKFKMKNFKNILILVLVVYVVESIGHNEHNPGALQLNKLCHNSNRIHLQGLILLRSTTKNQ